MKVENYQVMLLVNEPKVINFTFKIFLVFYQKDLNINNRQRNQTEYSDYNSLNNSYISNKNELNRNYSKKEIHTFRNEEYIESDRHGRYNPDLKNELRKREESNRLDMEDLKYYNPSQAHYENLNLRDKEKEISLSESLNSVSLQTDTKKYR